MGELHVHAPARADGGGGANDPVLAPNDRVTALERRARRERPDAPGRGLEPRALAVRRAGRTLRAPLTLNGCRFAGRIEVPDRGRWFVYAELRRSGRNIESWLPVEVGDGTDRTREPDRYAYEPDNSSVGAGQIIAGAILYLGMTALVVATFALVARPQRRPRHS